MPEFMNCLRFASTSSAVGPEYFCGVWFVGGNGICFINSKSKFRRKLAQYNIYHEREGKAHEPGVIEQADQSRRHSGRIELVDGHEKSRQARQRANQKRDDGNVTKTLPVMVFAAELVKRVHIQLALTAHKIIRNQHAADGPEQRPIASEPIENITVRVRQQLPWHHDDANDACDKSAHTK